MPNRADNTVSSTQVIPAGHAALTAEDDLAEHASPRLTGLVRLSVAALGVVFGDIGTSPVYTFRECFNPEHGLSLDAEHVLGVLSMIFWVLIIVVTVKYVLLIMRADNEGEGGISPCWPWPRKRSEASARALSWSCSARRRRSVFWRQYDYARNFRSQRRRGNWHRDARIKPVRPAAHRRSAACTFSPSKGRH
jgi:hypothetical protein